MAIKYIITISKDRASREKKVCLQRSSQFLKKKITIMKISIMYADFSLIVHQTWPTVLGMKKC